jgi:hypothetical protein
MAGEKGKFISVAPIHGEIKHSSHATPEEARDALKETLERAHASYPHAGFTGHVLEMVSEEPLILLGIDRINQPAE